MIDVERVAYCMPGVEHLKALNPGSYQTVFKIKLGFFTARFQGEMKVYHIDEGRHQAVMKVQGTDHHLSSSVQGLLDLKLKEQPPESTEVTVTMDLNLLGKLEILARPLIKPKARNLLMEFMSKVKEKLDKT